MRVRKPGQAFSEDDEVTITQCSQLGRPLLSQLDDDDSTITLESPSLHQTFRFEPFHHPGQGWLCDRLAFRQPPYRLRSVAEGGENACHPPVQRPPRVTPEEPAELAIPLGQKRCNLGHQGFSLDRIGVRTIHMP